MCIITETGAAWRKNDAFRRAKPAKVRQTLKY